MEEAIFTQTPPDQPGPAILSSLLRRTETEANLPVEVYRTGIMLQDAFTMFHFDLKFSISDNILTLYLHEHSERYELPNQDEQIWRNILKQYLNQQGFHQLYKPLKKIGKGNFASVYLVQRFSDGHRFAVKAFSKETAFSQQNGKQCLLKEIQIMRTLDSPHNLTLCEVFQSQNSLYIIFELITGGQLFEKIKTKQKLKPKQIQTIMRCLLKGLKQMHSKGVMHRDLKPQNILMRDEQTCECVVADYGLSQFCDSEEYLFVRCGTPGYVAPEVINIKDMKTKYGAICDMFSLGLIFHLLLFGKSIFKGKNYNQVLNQNRNCSFKLSGPEYEQVDSSTMDLLAKLLQVNPALRISAEQALLHPYTTHSIEEQLEVENEQLEQEMDKVEIGQSPILTTSNQQRKMQKDLKRDSCLSFKMGKDNPITGKTQTTGTMESGKMSGFGANLLKNFKPSKFSKNQQKQN